MSFQYIAFYKPYGVLCQFSGEEHDITLANFNLPKEVYPAGRLDKDSEGLLLLTNDGQFNQRLTNPRFHKEKTYWVQVERIPTEAKLTELKKGVKIKDYTTRACEVQIIDTPNVEDRTPPIRFRKNVPTCWLEIKITEGKNRQVRRMTASIGHPTLRLIRVKMGKLGIGNLGPGEWKEVLKKDII
jgi:23S rRNA pseudouridine2457 synthase